MTLKKAREKMKKEKNMIPRRHLFKPVPRKKKNENSWSR